MTRKLRGFLLRRTRVVMIAAAVLAAEKNLAPAQLAHGSFQKPALIACRRFLCKPGTVDPNPFGVGGERIKSVSGRSTGVIKPAGPVDPQFSVLSLQHIDGSPLAVLGNFSVHYCGGYQRGMVSADYFGHYAAALEAEGVFLELILDGHHVHPAMFLLARRAARGKLVLVSDAIRARDPATGQLPEEAKALIERRRSFYYDAIRDWVEKGDEAKLCSLN